MTVLPISDSYALLFKHYLAISYHLYCFLNMSIKKLPKGQSIKDFSSKGEGGGVVKKCRNLLGKKTTKWDGGGSNNRKNRLTPLMDDP
jgi:hypothetical protein